MAIQGVSAREGGIAFIATKLVMQVHFCDMADDALLIHHHPTFRPITFDFILIISYNLVVVAQVHREQIADDGHTADYIRSHPSTDVRLLFHRTINEFKERPRVLQWN